MIRRRDSQYGENHFAKSDEVAAENQKLQQEGLSREVYNMAYGIREFIAFVREQGVVGLAVGFMVGGAATRLVGSLVSDVINPLLALALGAAGDLSAESLSVGSAVLKWGNLVKAVIDFLVIAAVVYVCVRFLGLDKPTKKK